MREGSSEHLQLVDNKPLDPHSPEARIILDSLRPSRNTKRYHVTPKPRIPETNRYGLIIQPDTASYDPQNLTSWQRKQGTHQSEHHFYWPKKAFEQAGDLAMEFRSHPRNKRNYPNFQHRKFHRRYDPFILKYPTYLIPHKDVMVTFLDEAANLDRLGVHVSRIERILDGLVEMNGEREDELHASMQAAAELCTRVVKSELIFPSHVQVALHRASRYVPLYNEFSIDNLQTPVEEFAA